MCVCVRGLTQNRQLQREALWFDLGPVCHHAAYVFPVVCCCGNHAVLADHGHCVVGTLLGHCCRIAIGCGHPGDLGRWTAIDRLAACHDDLLGACFHCYDGGRVLRLS